MPILGKGDMIAAVRNLDYPEVVLYRATATRRSLHPTVLPPLR